MSITVTLLVVILLQQGLIALAWAVLAALRLSRRACLHWSAATIVVAVSLALVVQRDVLDRWTGFWLSGMLALLSFIMIRRGVLVFARRPRADVEHAVLLVALGIGLAWLTPPERQALYSALASAAYGYVLLRAASDIWTHLRTEFNAPAAACSALPIAAVGGLFCLRSVMAMLDPATVGSSLDVETRFNVVSAVSFLVAGLVLNFGLAALVLARLTLRLLHLSEHDTLTGLYNRRAIEHQLGQEAGRLARYGTPFSVLSVDIDHFKSINDAHGHPVGDVVLREFGRTLAAGGRATDRAARAGGEEFWLLMPSTGHEGAMQAAERLLRAVRAMRVPTSAGEVAFTVSIGVAVVDSQREPIESVMRRLDTALYAAKQGGRDRIALAPPA